MSAVLAWLGVWFLAAGWLLLSDFFLAPDPRGWFLAAAGTLLLILGARRSRWQGFDPWLAWLAIPLAVAAIIWPLPFKAGPLLGLVGLLLSLILRRARWLTPLALGLALASVIWMAQGGAMVAYWWLAARYHDVGLLTPIVQGTARLLGWTAGGSGGSLFLPHIEEMIQATTTWERLGTLPLMLLLAGGLALAPVIRWGEARRTVGRLLAALLLAVGYALLRYLALTALLAITRQPSVFWLPVTMALTYLPLALLLAVVLPMHRSIPAPLPAQAQRPSLRYAGLAGLTFLAAICLVGLFAFPDPGTAKAGRVLLDEYNSNWEWTTEELDTEWYGQKSGYNYYSLGQWLDYYFQVDTNLEPRTPDLLSGYDVLIIKTPTAPFASEELDAIEEWVRAGGGLFLIGDHTNVFGTSSYLNPLARRFGLRFRYDSTYDLPSLRVTLFDRPALLAHPAVVEMPSFLFATSCTLEAPLLAGNVMTGYGLRALSVDYGNRVFFPDKEKTKDYPFGLFLQSASVNHGRGRVVAFTDSTVFSNFTMFLAGKAEYFLGVMNWLNHEERWPWLEWALLVAAGLFSAGVFLLARSLNRLRASATILGALILAAAVGPWLGLRLAEAAYPLPEPHTEYTHIAFDKEHSAMTLPTTVMTSPPEANFQTFYVWTQRLGYVPQLSPTLEDALTAGQVVVLVDPFQPFEPDEVQAIEEYVAQGGRLLVLATPREGERYPNFANQVLAPFGLRLEFGPSASGPIYTAEGDAVGQLAVNGAVRGGQPLLTVKDRSAVMSLAHHGDGLVVAASFSRPFSDREMGTTSVRPNAYQRFLFEVEYWLFRSLVAGEFPPLVMPGAGTP